LAALTKKDSTTKVNGVRFASFGMVEIDLRGSGYIDAAWEGQTHPIGDKSAGHNQKDEERRIKFADGLCMILECTPDLADAIEASAVRFLVARSLTC
jgi:hypothetical protein